MHSICHAIVFPPFAVISHSHLPALLQTLEGEACPTKNHFDLVIKDTLSKIRAQGGETMDLTLDVDAMLAWTTVDTFPLMLFKDGKRIPEVGVLCGNGRGSASAGFG